MTTAPLSLACLGAVAAIALLTFPAGADEDWTRHVPGTYAGEIYSGAGNQPVSTEFTAEPDGLAGRYRFVENGQEVTGTLTACRSPSPYMLSCRWTDAYGAGTLVTRFRPDLQSFEGIWSSDAAPKERAPWWGKREITS